MPIQNEPQLQTQKIYHAPAQIFDFDLGTTVLRGHLKLKQFCDASGTSLDIVDQLGQQVRVETFNLNNNLLFSGTAIGSTTVGQDGKWSYRSDEDYSQGNHAVSYSIKNQKNSRLLISPIVHFTVDKQAVVDYGEQEFILKDGGTINTAKATIRGTGVPGQSVTIYNNSSVNGDLDALNRNLLAFYKQQYQIENASVSTQVKLPQGDTYVTRLNLENSHIDIAVQSRYGYAYVVLLNSPFLQDDAQKAQQQLQTLLKSLHTPGARVANSPSELPARLDLGNSNASTHHHWQQNYCS